jgi:uncharacterized protein
VQLVTLVVAQDASILAYLVLVARWRGVGSLRADFGFAVPRPGSWGRDLGYLPLGVGLQIALLIPTGLLQQLYGHTARQAVVDSASHAQGVVAVATALAVALLAPVTEELLFRGVLLRSFLRRWSPDVAVLASAAIFGLVHVLGDPSVGSLIALPAIVTLGVVSGYQAVKTGNLTRSMLLHIGFNALSVVILFS